MFCMFFRQHEIPLNFTEFMVLSNHFDFLDSKNVLVSKRRPLKYIAYVSLKLSNLTLLNLI